MVLILYRNLNGVKRSNQPMRGMFFLFSFIALSKWLKICYTLSQTRLAPAPCIFKICHFGMSGNTLRLACFLTKTNVRLNLRSTNVCLFLVRRVKMKNQVKRRNQRNLRGKLLFFPFSLL